MVSPAGHDVKTTALRAAPTRARISRSWIDFRKFMIIPDGQWRNTMDFACAILTPLEALIQQLAYALAAFMPDLGSVFLQGAFNFEQFVRSVGC